MASDRPLVPLIKAILILDDEGNRIARKVYTESPTAAAREDPRCVCVNVWVRVFVGG